MFVTVDELETYLQREFSPAELASAELALDVATEVIRGHTGQHISPVTVGATVEVFGAAHQLIFLPHPPAIPVTVTAVEVGGEPLTADQWRHLRELNAVERVGGVWFGDVKVTYDHGFAEAPGDVKAVILQAAQRAFTNPQGIQSERLGQYSITYTEGFGGSLVGAGAQLTNVEAKILDRYRLAGVA